MNVWQGLILGILQGVAEWLPISSEAVVNLVALNLFDIDPAVSLRLALLLHVGTVLAAIIYFRSELKQLLIDRSKETRQKWLFLIVATIVSVGLGGVVYLGLTKIDLSSAGLTILMGFALLLTAFLLSRKAEGNNNWARATTKDAIILGITQGLAVIPGISRSGSTMAVALWRSFSLPASISISFIMGIPMIVIGATLLVLDGSSSLTEILTPAGLVAVIASAVVGYLTIDVLLKVAKKISFVKFVSVFGFLAIIVGLLSL